MNSNSSQYHHDLDEPSHLDLSRYENIMQIKKINGFHDVVSHAFAYNESYLCINKSPNKEERTLILEKTLKKETPKKNTYLPGESLIYTDLISFYSNNLWAIVKGKVQITTHRLLFTPDDFSFLDKISIRKDFFHYPFTFIEEIAYLNRKEWDLPVEYKFTMKDARVFSLKIQPKPQFDFLKTYDFMISRTKIDEFRSFFAFAYKNDCQQTLKGKDCAWELYDIKAEMKRLGLNDKIVSGGSDKIYSLWRMIDNSDYTISASYPSFFVVPARISKEKMMKSADFRTKNRLPTMVYARKHDLSPGKAKYVTLWRSSQIMTGIRSSRCMEDETLLRLMGDPFADIEKDIPETMANNLQINLHIFDARCYSAALGNQLIGGGTESTASYKNCEVFFKNIENIHIVRDSYRKLCDLCNNNYNNIKWLSLIEETKWLEYVTSILTAARDVIESFGKGISVLVHCSDGWDRTTQIVSLAQIMMDPHFRTIKGFQQLIDKDWISFGHKFRLRNAVGSVSDDKSQNSPIFLQFLDCVHQILKQYPSAFEFNLKYLSEIAKHSYLTIFGNFLCNSEKEMMENEIMRKTNSLWIFLQPKKFKNHFYERTEEFVIPDTSMCSMKLWEEWFMHHTKIMKMNCCKNKKELYDDYYHCYYMNKKNQLELEKDKDYEIIDGKEGL